MIYLPVNSMKLNPNQSLTPQLTSDYLRIVWNSNDLTHPPPKLLNVLNSKTRRSDGMGSESNL